MSLNRRVRQLEQHRPPAPTARELPDDPVAFARGLMGGAFGFEDRDPRHPNHTGWAAQVCAFLGTLEPEHQVWLRDQRERHLGSYPDAFLLPRPTSKYWRR